MARRLVFSVLVFGVLLSSCGGSAEPTKSLSRVPAETDSVMPLEVPTTTTIYIEPVVIPPTTSSTSTTIARPLASSGCPQEVVDLIHQHFDPLGAGDWAVAIAWRESNCRPDVVSPTFCKGLFQLALPLHNDLFYRTGSDPSQWADPSANIRAAASLFAGSGEGPWAL